MKPVPNRTSVYMKIQVQSSFWSLSRVCMLCSFPQMFTGPVYGANVV